MRHFISITALLVVFFWVGQWSVQHGFANWVSVAGASETRKLSKEESQAKAMAERRYNHFMETYHKIWSLFGSIHDDFTGTPGNPKFTRIVGYRQSYETNKRHGCKMESDLSKFYSVTPQTPGDHSQSLVCTFSLQPRTGLNPEPALTKSPCLVSTRLNKGHNR